MEWIRRPLGPAARSQLSWSKALGLPGSPESINRRPAFFGLHFGAGKLTVCDRLGPARPRPPSLPPPPPTKGDLWSVGPAERQLLPPRARCRLVWKARGRFEVKRSARDWGLPPPPTPGLLGSNLPLPPPQPSDPSAFSPRLTRRQALETRAVSVSRMDRTSEAVGTARVSQPRPLPGADVPVGWKGAGLGAGVEGLTCVPV